jgi:hypothetical protein
MRALNEALIAELRQAIEVFFLKHNRPAGCQVFAYQRGNEHWFMIRRGDSFKRVATVAADGRSDTAGFYPEAFDVVVLDPVNEHLHIHADGVRANTMYGALFGFVLYGRETHFEDCTRFTLDPLRDLGRASLVCTDVPGIDKVHLAELHLQSGSAEVVKIRSKVGDVFDFLDAYKIELKHLRLMRAVFHFYLHGDPEPHQVTINPRNQTSYEHDEDSRVVREWMTQREFVKTVLPPKEVQDVAHLAFA